MNLYNLIKSERLKAGLTQQKLADKLGVKRPYISAIEAGIENLTMDSIKKIAMVLGKELVVKFKKAKN